MQRMFRIGTALLAALVLPSSTLAAANGKKLIEWGVDQPNTAYLRQHIAQMEQTPFDGTIFAASANNGASLSDAYWGAEAFTNAHFTNAVADLQATPFHKFTDNFLRLNVTPYGPSGGIDWFDNFTNIVNNSRVAAQLAHDGGVKGIIIDTEQYTQQIWSYQNQRDKSTKSYNVYAAQVRQRGREIMTAFQEGYPDLTVFLALGTSYPGLQAANEPVNLPSVSYGLMAPFIDGLFDAATGKTKIVDGFELGYPLSVAHDSKARIEWCMNYIHDKHQHPDWWNVLPIVGADDANYEEHISAGFATWLDYGTAAYPWDPNGTGNWFTPADLEETLKASLEYSDEYAWIYTEKVRWWQPDGSGHNLPAPYYQAVQNAVPEPASCGLIVALPLMVSLPRRRGRA